MMMRIVLFIIGFIILQDFRVFAQNNLVNYNETVKPRIRVIIDNDFGGDPDGLFQLAHHILSPSVEIRGIIGSKHYKDGFYGSSGTATYACKQVDELLRVMKLTGKFSIYEGANTGLTDIKTPVITDAAKALVQEAMRDDTKLPLYVVCGAGLTNIASAFLMEPAIAEKLILVWIGGPEYEARATPSGEKSPEYNLGIDIKACQVVYNVSNISVWQVPRNTYRQALYSYPELVYRLKTKGNVGKYLIKKLEDLMKRANRSLGEAYVLGDSPLVLLTALHSSWENDPSSSRYVIKPAPIITDSGLYEEKSDGRKIRIYSDLDTRLMFEDLVAKIALLKMAH
jgi:purine nucleosidase